MPSSSAYSLFKEVKLKIKPNKIITMKGAV